MPTPDSDLYRRLLNFPIDEGTPALSFEARLARENGWDTAFARRVVLEYRRFLFLALTADHTVTPSESVDQAWHLHLTYTRSYWERMCGELLGRPLHHGPTRGGAAESRKFRDLYTSTLASYRLTFGETPPADVWPPVDVRFGEAAHFVRVNTARNWVVPKSALRRGLRSTGFGFGVVACAAGCGGVVADPFDLVGTDYLWFLVPLLLAALAVGLWLRNALRGPGTQPADESQLDWADAAYLAGGPHRLTTAAIARLVATGAARVSADGKVMEAVGAAPPEMSDVEREVFDALPFARDEREKMAHVARWVDRAFAERAAELRTAGYLLSAGRMVASGFAAVFPLFAVAVGFGGSRLVSGIETGKPVGLLLFTLIAALVTGVLLFLVSLNRTTRRGTLALACLRATAAPPPMDAKPDAVGQLVGLYGTSALAGCVLVDLAAFATWCPRPTPGGGDGGGGCGTGCTAGSGGDGGAGCGGGGCGGGGCGGGCGGCGG
ncbi:TIGR04222 domain-containing membrane protein [Frigoriglobus tundricola]|uniref:TIGR04222 domain-containing membrane protein n=1 Tax=Frigoriglobus tundricola TaxID=2774151 RepID=A0A6M5YKE3_9BACT|nr:TIGR04222 domain-containing membrane protein [Frigoriglobus tundricola]QJW93810.1 hypothetical protein FTUN_1321 [Frigoriglobus tundricola]